MGCLTVRVAQVVPARLAVSTRYVCLTMLFLALACRDAEPGLTPPEMTKVRRYLDCIDCIERLDSMRALAARKPEATVDSLNSALLNGPGVQAVAAADSVLAIGFIRDSSWQSRNARPVRTDRQLYISEARDRFVNGYRSRGAYGMGWIHTPRAVAYLDSAAGITLPPSVRRAVLYARDSLPPPTR